MIKKIDEIKNNIFSVLITDKQMCYALKDLRKLPNFNEDFKLKIKKFGDIFA